MNQKNVDRILWFILTGNVCMKSPGFLAAHNIFVLIYIPHIHLINCFHYIRSLVEDLSPVSRPISVQENKDEQDTEKVADDASGKFSSVSKKSVGKKPSGTMDKKGAKDSGTQLPDMVEEIVNVDHVMLGISMLTLQAGATLKSCSLFEHLESLSNRKVNLLLNHCELHFLLNRYGYISLFIHLSISSSFRSSLH